MRRTRTFWEFDDAATAPLHGFRDADEYYTRSSSIHFLGRIKTPTLAVNAEDDPLLPADALDICVGGVAGYRDQIGMVGLQPFARGVERQRDGYREKFGAARWQEAVEAATREMIAQLAAATTAGKLRS